MSSLRGSAARQLDVLSMMLCPAAHAWRRTAVRSGGSVRAKEGAHLCSGQSQATIGRRSAPRRRPRGRVLAEYKWTAACRRRFSSPATNLQQGLRASTRAHGHPSSVGLSHRHRRRRCDSSVAEAGASTAAADTRPQVRELKKVTFPLATESPRLAPTLPRALYSRCVFFRSVHRRLGLGSWMGGVLRLGLRHSPGHGQDAN